MNTETLIKVDIIDYLDAIAIKMDFENNTIIIIAQSKN